MRGKNLRDNVPFIRAGAHIYNAFTQQTTSVYDAGKYNGVVTAKMVLDTSLGPNDFVMS
jgi:hypothetical protein